MHAVILNFRRGRHTQKTNQFLLAVDGFNSRSKAGELVGKKVVWKSPAGKEIHGVISGPHGNRGIVKARFSKGLPGTAIGNKVKILD
jgi:large subunit ribosomal protein L35Ae